MSTSTKTRVNQKPNFVFAITSQNSQCLFTAEQQAKLIQRNSDRYELLFQRGEIITNQQHATNHRTAVSRTNRVLETLSY
jgi:hypothetical protein